MSLFLEIVQCIIVQGEFSKIIMNKGNKNSINKMPVIVIVTVLITGLLIMFYLMSSNKTIISQEREKVPQDLQKENQNNPDNDTLDHLLDELQNLDDMLNGN